MSEKKFERAAFLYSVHRDTDERSDEQLMTDILSSGNRDGTLNEVSDFDIDKLRTMLGKTGVAKELCDD